MKQGSLRTWRILALISGDRRHGDPQKVSGDDGENDKLIPDSGTRLIDLSDCDLNSVSVQISRWTEGKYFAVQCQNFLWHHGGGGIARKVDVKRETGIEIQYLMIKGVPKCQDNSIKSTVPIGYSDHPPSEGSRSLNPARPLKPESGYSNQVVLKSRVWI